MSDWKHLWGLLLRTLQITGDADITAADALQLATDRPMCREVAMAANAHDNDDDSSFYLHLA